MAQLGGHALLGTPQCPGVELIVVVKEALGVDELCEVSGFAGNVFIDAAAAAAAADVDAPSPGGLYAAISAEYYGLPMEEAMANERIQGHGARSRKKSWVKGNMEGDSRQLGGMLIGGNPSGQIAFGYTEGEWGDHAVHECLDELLVACRAIAGKAPKASL